MSNHSSKSLEEIKKYDEKQDSNKVYSHSTSDLKRKRSLRSDIHSDELNGKYSNYDVKRRKKEEQKQTIPDDVPSCSKEKSIESKCTNLQQFLQEELTCSICSELFMDAVTLNCSHSFCDFCIIKWMKEQSTCPICRKPIDSRNSSLVLDRCVDKTLEHLPQESREHRRMLAKVRENQKDIVPPVLDPADPDAEQMINDFLCWFGVTEFMEFFDIRNQDDDRANYNQNENCTIS